MEVTMKAARPLSPRRPRASLDGPSKTITVEPLETPVPAPPPRIEPEPERDPAPPTKKPAEPVPTP
jgi:hypothetical protein